MEKIGVSISMDRKKTDEDLITEAKLFFETYKREIGESRRDTSGTPALLSSGFFRFLNFYDLPAVISPAGWADMMG